jgi:hypothetical protein
LLHAWVLLGGVEAGARNDEGGASRGEGSSGRRPHTVYAPVLSCRGYAQTHACVAAAATAAVVCPVQVLVGHPDSHAVGLVGCLGHVGDAVHIESLLRIVHQNCMLSVTAKGHSVHSTAFNMLVCDSACMCNQAVHQTVYARAWATHHTVYCVLRLFTTPPPFTCAGLCCQVWA